MRKWQTIKEYEDIKFDFFEGIAKITINRPRVYNAFRPQTNKEMLDAMTICRERNDIGVVVLTGAGDKAFCSGGDQHVKGVGGYIDENGVPRLNVLDLHKAIRSLPKPVIAMVNGYAIGGGHVLHVICDLTIASENARFGQTGPKVGSFDGGFGSSYLARCVGEGTILTVARVASEKAAASDAADVPALWDVVMAAGQEALDDTPNLLPVLKKAGVVDAGGQGILIIFEGMGKVFHGEPIVAGGEAAPNKAKLSTENAGKGVFTDDLMKVEDIKNGYCTQFLINKYEGASAAKMRAFAESNGDSVVCIEDDDVINLHVHTADPGKILSEAIKYGYLTNFKIENMHEQFLARQKQGKSLEKQASAEKAPSQASEFVYAAVDPSRDYGFVAVAAGEGLKSVFTDLAADAVVSGGQTMNPSTEDILAAIQSVPAKTVFVLPNNKNIIMAAEQAEKLADRQVVVLPTRTVPMGITAMLNFDPSVNAETNTINMMAAADKVSTGLITYAARDSEYDGKRIKKGEIMALENGKIVSTSTDITKATYRLARGMCKKDSSFVTIISGCDVSDEDAEKVTEMVKAKCPNHVEVSHIRGGQPVYYYMISVE